MSFRTIMGLFTLVAFSTVMVTGCAFEDKKASIVAEDGDEIAVDGDEPIIDGDESVLDGDEEPTLKEYAVTAPANWINNIDRTPEDVHMTWQRDPATTVTIQWRTKDTDTSAYSPKVWIVEASKVTMDGDDVVMPYAPEYLTEGSGFNYKASSQGVSGTEFVFWTVEVAGLKPNTDYYYRAGTFGEVTLDDNALTAEMSAIDFAEPIKIKTGVTKGSSEPFRFISGGDSRGAYDLILENIENFRSYKADFTLFNGDMTNAGGQDEWISWFGAMNPLMKEQVLMPVQGNHEILADYYYHQFALPKVGNPLPEEWQEHAWSFDYGNVHFIGFNSVTEFVIEEQKAWIEADLKAAKADPDTKWIMAMFHHPAYSASGKHGSTDYVEAHVVPLLEKYDVDMAFSGHDHNYERTCPIRENECKEDTHGVTYIVVGGFYADGYSNGSDWWTVESFDGDIYNYMVVDVDGSTVTCVAYDGNHNELDRVVLTK